MAGELDYRRRHEQLIPAKMSGREVAFPSNQSPPLIESEAGGPEFWFGPGRQGSRLLFLAGDLQVQNGHGKLLDWEGFPRSTKGRAGHSRAGFRIPRKANGAIRGGGTHG